MRNSGSQTIAEGLAAWSQQLSPASIPPAVATIVQQLLIDISGLCIAARHTDYIKAISDSCDSHGNCTVIGHTGSMDRYDAALINGTAAHGEDFDDTFEGTPVHVGAVIIPAVMAAVESTPNQTFSGDDILKAIALGGELSCRMALVTPMAMHRAGFSSHRCYWCYGGSICCKQPVKARSDQYRTSIGRCRQYGVWNH